MVPALTVLVIAAYAVAAFLLYRDRSLRPLLLLISGSLATLIQPLLVRLFGNDLDVPGNVLRFGTNYSVPVWTFLGGGVLLAVPPLVVAYGLRHRWWGRHYAANWSFFVAFVLFFLVIDALDLRSKTELFARPEVPDGRLLQSMFHIVLLSGVSFGMLYSFVATRHYALRVAIVPLLLSGVGATLLFNGILASPFWVARFLSRTSTLRALPIPSRLVVGSVFIALLLILWSIHLLASGLHAGRRQQLQWR